MFMLLNLILNHWRLDFYSFWVLFPLNINILGETLLFLKPWNKVFSMSDGLTCQFINDLKNKLSCFFLEHYEFSVLEMKFLGTKILLYHDQSRTCDPVWAHYWDRCEADLRPRKKNSKNCYTSLTLRKCSHWSFTDVLLVRIRTFSLAFICINAQFFFFFFFLVGYPKGLV